MDVESRTSLVAWLMAGDPAIRWQTQRDLLDAPTQVYTAERQRMVSTGWGAALLERQDPGGTWGGGLYSPKWISTTYTLLSLRFIGLPPDNPQAQVGCRCLLEGGFFQEDGGINFSRYSHNSETCITGMVLSILAYFRYPDERLQQIAAHLLNQQMPDGGWNCQSYRGATHSSFHTTISALEGLYQYARRYPAQVEPIYQAQGRAHEFLLRHRLYRSHRTGEIVNPAMTRFPFPPRWYYDVLRALDYFQAVGASWDARFQDAIQLLQKKSRADGRWSQYRGPTGRTFFELEPAGEPGRWNTLRAMRVLRWWEASQGSA